MIKQDSKRIHPGKWRFEIVEVSSPEASVSDFEEIFADLLVECWNKNRSTNVRDFELSQASIDAPINSAEDRTV